ncbi:hypothetical protein OUZ56_028215 [Daphnia magna]|uniref:Peptidase M1 membrane alanine aminopeptidase domain-containing protein n=1 Tax=Daphnia magna TaxID=35525 RepID=A0ABR0B3C3_9CRUS|nr:hypothetical protein OUZ56_028215 [Daphnia magna]
MCADFIGFEVFQRGLTRYLNDHIYGNAYQDDLWSALQTQVDLENVNLPATIKEIMDTWTYKMDFPFIRERFLLRKRNDSTDSIIYPWWVPLTYTSDFTQAAKRDWLTVGQISKPLTNLGIAAHQWVIFNVEQRNYYYDAVNYGLIRDQLIADHQRFC